MLIKTITNFILDPFYSSEKNDSSDDKIVTIIASDAKETPVGMCAAFALEEESIFTGDVEGDGLGRRVVGRTVVIAEDGVAVVSGSMVDFSSSSLLSSDVLFIVGVNVSLKSIIVQSHVCSVSCAKDACIF
jgi:hypothetical protein